MATYNTQHVKGDLKVSTSGSSQFGLGKISVENDLEITGAFVAAQYRKIFTADANLEIASQRTLRLASGSTQGIDITANNVSTWKTTAGQLNITNDTDTITITSGVDSNVSITGGTNTGSAIMDGKNINIGTTATPTTITIGSATCPSTNVLGAGMNIGSVLNIDTSKLFITNNLYEINSGLITTNNDYGMLVRRHLDDVALDANPLQINLDSDANTGSTTVVVQYSANQTTDYFTGWTLIIGTEKFIVNTSFYTMATTTTTLNIDGTLTATTLAGVQVSLQNTTFTAMFYSEANKEWRISYTNSINGSRLINQNQYATLHVGSIVLENEITTSSMKVVTLLLGANQAFAGRVQIAAADGTLSGSYIIIANREVVNGGATATFNISKSLSTNNRDAFRVSSDPGSDGEELFCTWQGSEYLSFYHYTLRSLGNLTEIITYKIRLITIA